MYRWQGGMFPRLARPALAGAIILGEQAIRGAGVTEFGLQKFFIIGFAQCRIGLAVKEGEEGVAPAAGHRRDLVQRTAGEYDRAARRRAISAAAELGKNQIAAVLILVEVDRHGKAAVLRAGIDVVAMAIEMSADRAVVTGDDVAIHPGRRELKKPRHG